MAMPPRGVYWATWICVFMAKLPKTKETVYEYLQEGNL